jgi:hypothetical protein
MSFDNLLNGPAPTYLPTDDAASELLRGDPRQVARAYPSSSLVWAVLADGALEGDAAIEGDTDIEGYAFARVGYHRGLDALRRSGWKGYGPIPWSHEPNRGFLRCLAALATASDRIGDTDEAVRCRQFLLDADPDCPLL